ncbi:MAG: pyrroline-5-carboxylate reductase [Proteobacteria bacterium]|nr:pyrroline-5-carboxylate reductase [Pseudomonadota bacterium]
MEKKIGFIGCGNMGKAILGGLIASGQLLPGQIWVYTPSPDKVAALHDQFGINAAQSAQEVAQIADIVFGAVKPNIMVKVLSEIASSLNKETLVVSIAAGVTLDQLARALGHDRKIVRAMPNTPSLVNAGMTSITPNALVTPEDTADVLNIFLAAQAVMGSAKMVLDTGKHPGELKDMVCSPGGTTIEAVKVLEERGFRAAVIEAMEACMNKSEKLSK